MSDTCTWYVVDISTAVGPEDFVPYSSFNEALANIDAFTNLGIVWGSASADWNGDGSAPFVEINFSLGAWNFIIGIVGNNSADSGGPFADAQTALSAAQSSPFLPAGFCLSSTDPCDPNALMQAARCFVCIPKGKLREVIIYLLCRWNIPVNISIPVITGTSEVGQTLTGSNGTWTRSPTSYTYRWLANGVAIAGQTSNTLLLTMAQYGTVITFEVTAHNASGASLPATSAATVAVQAVIDWVPASALAFWLDSGGVQAGNLAFFKANADLPTVTFFQMPTLALTSLSGIITLPAVVDLDCGHNKLTAAGSINQILTDLVTNGQLAGIVKTDLQTPLAPPTAGPPSGIAAKATLIARGWAVTTD